MVKGCTGISDGLTTPKKTCKTESNAAINSIWTKVHVTEAMCILSCQSRKHTSVLSISLTLPLTTSPGCRPPNGSSPPANFSTPSALLFFPTRLSFNLWCEKSVLKMRHLTTCPTWYASLGVCVGARDSSGVCASPFTPPKNETKMPYALMPVM